jgi:hypothetical protein
MNTPFASVFDGREPLRIKSDSRALDISFILTLDIRQECFKPCEADQGQDFSQAMDLNDGFNIVADPRAPPSIIRQSPCVEVQVYWYVIAEAYGHGFHSVQLGLLYGFVALSSVPNFTDRI